MAGRRTKMDIIDFFREKTRQKTEVYNTKQSFGCTTKLHTLFIGVNP